MGKGCPARRGGSGFQLAQAIGQHPGAQFRRIVLVNALHGSGLLAASVGAAGRQTALVGFSCVRLNTLHKVRAAVVKPARHRICDSVMGAGLSGRRTSTPARRTGEHFRFAIVQRDAAHQVAGFLHPLETAQHLVKRLR